MGVTELLDEARRTIGVERVFGQPLERDGTTIIPAASVSGGGGGGSGDDGEGQRGEGGGFGLRGRPAGAYVVHGGVVRWRPAVDVNRAITALTAIVITYLVTRVRRERVRRLDA